MRATLLMTLVLVAIVEAQAENRKNSIEPVKNKNLIGKQEEFNMSTNQNVRNNTEKLALRKDKPIMRKCCDVGKIIINKENCTDRLSNFDLAVYKKITTEGAKNSDVFNVIEGLNVTEYFDIRVEFFNNTNCEQNFHGFRLKAQEHQFKLLEDGMVLYENDPKLIGPEQYCIDNLVSSNVTKLVALICNDQEQITKLEENRIILNSICLLISCFFIILTLAVYVLIPELRNLHGMVLMAYLLSFFLAFLFLATLQLLVFAENHTSINCFVFTFTIYFFSLAAFFWMNVMSYDIWLTFSNPTIRSLKNTERVRFCKYSIYAFGMPTLLTFVLAILEFSIDPLRSEFLPRIGSATCFLTGYSKLIYLYVPLVLLCVTNLVFFTLTALKIAETKKLSRNVLNNNDKQRFSVYIKLFIIMGFNWVLEVLSCFFEKVPYMMEIIDAYNALIGLFIFIIFVCKNNTWIMIKQRIRDCQRSNTNIDDIQNLRGLRLNHWSDSKGIRSSIETTRSSLDSDSTSVRSKRSINTIPTC